MEPRRGHIVATLIKLAAKKDLDPDVAVPCQAVLHLFSADGTLHSDDLQTFAQIEDLDRRQRPGDE